MNQAWARWVLVVCNGLGAAAIGVLGFLTIATGLDHHVGDSLWYIAIPVVAGVATLGSLAHRQTQRQGRIFQSVIAGIALLTMTIPGVLYGAFALATVWWLGDFLKTDEPPPLTGAPDTIARVMWRRGDSDQLIRAALTARNVPADEIEKLLYEFARDEEARQRMSPGR